MNSQLIGTLLQIAGSLTLLYSYLPQIIQLIKTKETKGMNIQFWLVLTFGLVCITGNMVLSKVPLFILATQGANALLALITLILVVKYKRK